MEEASNYSCQYTTLHHSDYGYVVQCLHCGGYQLAFGNIMLNLLAQEFKALLDYVWLQHSATAKCDERHSKSIHIPTDSRKTSIVLSVEELLQLNDLLQQAFLMQQVYETLNNKN